MAPEVLAASIDWSWETFAEYLDAVAARPKGINYAADIGHSARRAAGIRATIVRGQTVLCDGEPTGARPGRLLRGPLAR
jgi:N-acyl-D-aspartate/D-glutamate deacylase